MLTTQFLWGLLVLAFGLGLLIYVWGSHILALPGERSSAREHLTRTAGHHAGSALLTALGLVLMATSGGVAAYQLLHHGGARVNHHLHITPPHRFTFGGATLTPDLSFALQGDVPNQQKTLSCCANTIAAQDQVGRFLRDGEVFPDHPISGPRICYYVSGCTSSGSNPLDDAATYNQIGAEGWRYWGAYGIPDVTDAAHVTGVAGTSASWDFYLDGGGGQAGLDDIIYRLAHKTPVGLLWSVHRDGDAALGAFLTYDGGAWAYYHCVMAVQYTPDLPGLGGPAVKVIAWYGREYGVGGYIWLPAEVVRTHVLGAFVEVPGPAIKAWLPPAPTATKTPDPTATATVTIGPTVTMTPAPPAPTATPAPPTVTYWGVYRTLRATNLRALPVAGARVVRGVPAGERVRGYGAITTHWVKATSLGKPGWIPRDAVRHDVSVR